MSFGQQVAGAVIGGAIGAVAWVTVAYCTGYEIGFVAWGVGLLTGLGAMSMSGGRASALGGVAAGLVALGAVLAGKAGIAYITTDEIRAQLRVDGGVGKDMAIGALAEEVQKEYSLQGRTVDDAWPPGVLDKDDVRAFYAPQVWAEAERRWAQLPTDEKLLMRGRVERHVKSSPGGLYLAVFSSSFQLVDVIWLVLASMSAFKIASTAEPAFVRRSREQKVHAPPRVQQPDEVNTGFLPMRQPQAKPGSTPLSHRGMDLSEHDRSGQGEDGGATVPGEGHADTPDLNRNAA